LSRRGICELYPPIRFRFPGAGAHAVREITERHAEKLTDLLDTIEQASGSCIPGEADRLRGLFQSAIADYAEDFGTGAAKQLEAYVRRQIQMRDRPYSTPTRRH
jgi:DNA-binding GntR family transcriptional regulator